MAFCSCFVSLSRPVRVVCLNMASFGMASEVRATCSIKMIGQNGLRLARIVAATQLDKEGTIEDSALDLLTSMMFELFVKVRL